MFEKEREEKPKSNDEVYNEWRQYIELRKKFQSLNNE